MKNQGVFSERILTNPREKAFAELWEKENNGPITHAINFGNGLLQDLFCERIPDAFISRPYHVLHEVTESERMVAATVVQWLGTNCGMSFLDMALRNCGYEIRQLPTD